MRNGQIFVFLMLILIPLQGCLDNSSSETSTTSYSNEIILFDVVTDCSNLEIYVQSTPLANGSIANTIIGVNATFYHTAYSATSPNLTVEYDLDLDGIGDVFNNISRGTTTIFVPISHFSNLSSGDFMTTIAATARSDNGHASDLIHIASDCSILSEIDLGQLSTTRGDYSMYQFEVREAGTTLSTDGGEALVYVALEKGDDLSWSQVIVQMKVGDSAYVACSNPDKTAGAECAVSDNDDGEWKFAEDITVSEGSTDLCDGVTTCTVTIKILDSATQDKIYESQEISLN